jgi:hypothetical protein
MESLKIWKNWYNNGIKAYLAKYMNGKLFDLVGSLDILGNF